jgi:hypothetical protein
VRANVLISSPNFSVKRNFISCDGSQIRWFLNTVSIPAWIVNIDDACAVFLLFPFSL